MVLDMAPRRLFYLFLWVLFDKLLCTLFNLLFWLFWFFLCLLVFGMVLA